MRASLPVSRRSSRLGRQLHLREPRRRILPAVRARFYRALLIPLSSRPLVFLARRGAAWRGLCTHRPPIRERKLQSRARVAILATDARSILLSLSLFEARYDALTRRNSSGQAVSVFTCLSLSLSLSRFPMTERLQPRVEGIARASPDGSSPSACQSGF